MAAAVRRGRCGVWSARSSASSEPVRGGIEVVEHHGSHRNEGGGAGMEGTPGPREQVGPEHGTSRPGASGACSARPPLGGMGESGWERASRADRPGFETT
jgi:hypothetical protein